MSDEAITTESPFDIVKVYESNAGGGPYPLYRAHRDAVDSFVNHRHIPPTAVFAVLAKEVDEATGISHLVGEREAAGFWGLVWYIQDEVSLDARGSREIVTNYIRGRNDT